MERHGGKGRWRAILHPAEAQQLNTFILTCSVKMAVSCSHFKIVGTVDLHSCAAGQHLSDNVTEAKEASVPMSVKQGQNNEKTNTAAGSNSPKIEGTADTMLPGNQK